MEIEKFQFDFIKSLKTFYDSFFREMLVEYYFVVNFTIFHWSGN